MLDLDLAKNFAALLNRDQFEESPTSKLNTYAANQSFNKWWLVKGRPQYPYWSALTEAEINWLSEKTGLIAIGEIEIPVPRAMELTIAMRRDVIAKFSERSVNSTPNQLAMAGWFFSSGIHEHLFTDLINAELIRQLDRPIRSIYGNQDISSDSVPLPTALMVLVWNMLDDKLREIMNLSKPEARIRFIGWFFSNAFKVFKLELLTANRWKSWLLEEIVLEGGLGSLPRFVAMANSLMPTNQRPNINTPLGFKQMSNWGIKQLGEKGDWNWLVSKDLSRTQVNFPRFNSDISISSISLKNRNRKPFGLNLIGFAYGELGIGEDIRMAAAACEAASIPYKVVNIQPGDEIRQNDQLLKDKVESSSDDPDYAINVFIMPGFDTASRIFLKMGDKVFRDSYNIGWWPWELSVWPKSWGRAFELIDEVWAGSQFSFDMYRQSTDKPCQLMPLAVSINRVKKIDRTHFNLPLNDYLFLYIFDLNSHLNRKNPYAAIESFVKAFPASNSLAKRSNKKNAEVGLVLKVMNSRPTDESWLRFVEYCELDARIYLINKTLDREEVLGLVDACDAYVSPHRAEGFGRTMAEAMLLGKPVIATNYSGNAFYMDDKVTFPVDYELVPVKNGDYHFVENSDCAQWAEPIISSMIKNMRSAIAAKESAIFSSSVKKFALKFFAPSRVGNLISARIRELENLVSNE